MAVGDFLRRLLEVNGSDLHLRSQRPPYMRVDGLLQPCGEEVLSAAAVEACAAELMTQRQADSFAETNESDFAYSLPGSGRFRVNAFRQRGSVGIVVRRVLPSSATLADLGMPPALRTLASEPRGLVLVTGPTGSGKTTTTGAFIGHINATRRCHIMTVEDPIEILHRDQQSIVSQREVGIDTADFPTALKHVMRQDPDVIFIGEMRDTVTVRAALQAAETGHFVVSTLHTVDAVETVNRVLDFFPAQEQQQIRRTLAGCLRGIVSQRLLPSATGSGRVAAVEVLIATGRVVDCIRDPERTGELSQVIKEGEFYGMQTFDQGLLRLLLAGKVTMAAVMEAATSPHDLRLAARQAGLAA